MSTPASSTINSAEGIVVSTPLTAGGISGSRGRIASMQPLRHLRASLAPIALAVCFATAAPPAAADGTVCEGAPHDAFSPGPSGWNVPGQPRDEAGNTNTQTDAKVREAVRLIRTGRKYVLGHTYENSMPLFPGNLWSLESKAPLQVFRQVANADMFHGEISQNGTQLDAFGHFGLIPTPASAPTDSFHYNCFRGHELYGADGLQHLGVENLKPFFTRGILIDVLSHLHPESETLPADAPQLPNATHQQAGEITVSDVKRTLSKQGMSEDDIRPGDVVLIRTGWESKWNDPTGTVAYYAGAPGVPGRTPGVGLDLAVWLAAKQVAAVGSDNWGVEVAPKIAHTDDPTHPTNDPNVSFPVHNELIIKHGIPHQESMVLSELAGDALDKVEERGRAAGRDAYTFAYIFVPVPLEGASGSPGVPIAIR